MEFEEENTVTVQDLFQSLAERLQQSASVRSVFGEPIAAQGRTIIPVAKISYGFGGGTGMGRRGHPEAGGVGEEGAGGGGGIAATPAGVIEVTEAGARFIPIRQTRMLIGGLVSGFVLGLWIGRRRSKSPSGTINHRD